MGLDDWFTVVNYAVHHGEPIRFCSQDANMGNVVKLPRHSRASRDQAEQVRQYVLDLELSVEARAEIDNALYRITETPGKRWLFVMISPEQFRFVTKSVENRLYGGRAGYGNNLYPPFFVGGHASKLNSNRSACVYESGIRLDSHGATRIA